MLAASTSIQDIGGDGALLSAVRWLEAMLLGSLGTVLAVLAIASVGFAMLLGRLSPRDGIRVLLGCFILFGAPSMAGALADLAYSVSAVRLDIKEAPTPPQILDVPEPPPPIADPYAGAAVPM